MQFDDILTQIGTFGKYQKIVFLSVAIPQILSSLYTFMPVFTLSDQPFR